LLPELDATTFAKTVPSRPDDPVNAQTPEVFAGEEERLREAFQPVKWSRPSDSDPDLIAFESASIGAWDPPLDTTVIVGGSLRGVVLHKLWRNF
jgi:hypothetical protein